MILFLLALVVASLSQVVLSNLQFQISQVMQCEPVSITFIGDPNTGAVPMTLTLIPLDSRPVSIHIPNATTDMSGVYVTFFPFAQGTSFVASLDDASKNSTTEVSAIMNVLASPTGNTACLPPVQNSTNIFTIDSNVSQCQEFSLTYDRSVLSHAPSIRLFDPQGPSFALDLKADQDNGTARYLMNFNRGGEIILLVDGGRGHRETSPLITIGGDSTSSDKCLKNSDIGESGRRVSLALIIGSAVGGAIFFLLVSVFLFIIRQRRRRRIGKPQFKHTSFLEKAAMAGPRSILKEKFPGLDKFPLNARAEVPRSSPVSVTDNPPYTAEEFPFSPRDSIWSWAQPVPKFYSEIDPRRSGSFRYMSGSHHTLNSLDIEVMLNTATVQSHHSSGIMDLSPIPSSVSSPPSPAHTRSYSSPSSTQFPFLRQHSTREQALVASDIPMRSMYSSSTLSLYRDNPFADSTITDPSRPPITRGSSLDSAIRPPPSAVISQPSSPSHGSYRSRDRDDGTELFEFSASRSTQDSLGDWYGTYGIAR